MTELAQLPPLVLAHVAITLIAIGSGLYVLGWLLLGRLPTVSNQVFLLFTFLTSATGFLIQPQGEGLSPAQVTGVLALVTLVVALYAFYAWSMIGIWRAIYVVTAIIGLYLNVFVLIVQLFTKVPALAAMAGNPPSGPVFGAVQGAVLVFFIIAGWEAVKRYRPG